MSKKGSSPRWPADMLLSTAAEYLDTSSKTVARLIADGKLGAVQFTPRGDRRIPRAPSASRAQVPRSSTTKPLPEFANGSGPRSRCRSYLTSPETTSSSRTA